MDKKRTKGEVEKFVKNMNILATRLPWIAVALVLISMVLIILEVIFRDS